MIFDGFFFFSCISSTLMVKVTLEIFGLLTILKADFFTVFRNFIKNRQFLHCSQNTFSKKVLLHRTFAKNPGKLKVRCIGSLLFCVNKNFKNISTPDFIHFSVNHIWIWIQTLNGRMIANFCITIWDNVARLSIRHMLLGLESIQLFPRSFRFLGFLTLLTVGNNAQWSPSQTVRFLFCRRIFGAIKSVKNCTQSHWFTCHLEYPRHL